MIICCHRHFWISIVGFELSIIEFDRTIETDNKIILLTIVLLSAAKTINEPSFPIPWDKTLCQCVFGSPKTQIDQDNNFAFDLLKQTPSDFGESNVFISPLSVNIALGMTWNGANGNTVPEIGFQLSRWMECRRLISMIMWYKTMQTTLPGMDPTTKLNIANSLWYKEGYPLKTDFLKLNTDYFNAEVRSLDFWKSMAVDTINNWCTQNQSIDSKVLNEISRYAAAFLINAVYFKGIWRKSLIKKYRSFVYRRKGQRLK